MNFKITKKLVMDSQVIEKYGKQSGGDNIFTRKARLLQSMYRIELKEFECGYGPNKNSKEKYGNMLLNGDKSGKNFFFNETFEYAHQRVKNKKQYETIDDYRLFNNMLSSMPMAFNLFHPLMMIKEKYPSEINNIVKKLFPELPINKVTSIEIEFIPAPPEKYINDKSAMDTAIVFTDKKSKKYIIAIETKYTDSLGTNKARDNKRKLEFAIESGLFTDEGINHIKNGCTQIYRNFLLTESYRFIENFHDSYSIILAPQEHPTTVREIESLKNYLKEEYHYKLNKYSLEDFVSIIKENSPVEFKQWIEQFYSRYLDFNKLKTLLSNY